MTKPDHRRSLRVAGLAAIVAAPLLYAAFHGKKPPDEERPKTETVTSDSHAYAVYLVDDELDANQLNPWDRAHLQHAVLSKPFAVVIELRQLVPNRSYQIGCDLTDTNGRKVQGDGKNPATFTATEAKGWVSFSFHPNPIVHTAGNWKAMLEVSELGKVEYAFETQGLTPEEKVNLADHEEAKGEAIRTFAKFWVGITHNQQQTYVTASAENPRAKDTMQRYSLYQVGGLTLAAKQAKISDADRLNGVTYRGSIGMGFSLYRVYTPEAGWTEWRDVERPGNIAEEAWRKMAGKKAADPEIGQQAPAMRFRVQRQDGNWVVTTDEGMRFVNGARKDGEARKKELQKRAEQQKKAVKEGRTELRSSKPEREEVNPDGPIELYDHLPPDPNQITDPIRPTESDEEMAAWEKIIGGRDPHDQELFSGDVFEPRFDIVEQISNLSEPERAGTRQFADEAQATPEALRQQEEMTIKSFSN